MLSVSLAQELKAAGLEWAPHERDFFAVPDRGLDEHIFVINFMMVGISRVRGEPVVTFHGTSEMPLDYMPLSEAVWLPHESQLRTLLEEKLVSESSPTFHLTSTTDGYRCEIQFHDRQIEFEGFGVDEVYGQALLYVLKGE